MSTSHTRASEQPLLKAWKRIGVSAGEAILGLWFLLYPVIVWSQKHRAIAIPVESVPLQENKLRISANPRLIRVGKSSTLSWITDDANAAFILGVGKVGLSGTVEVYPTQTTVYTLISEGPTGIRTKNAEVQVAGARGEDANCPGSDAEQFRYPISFDVAVRSVVQYLDTLHRTLQDSLKFTVKESQVPDQQHFRFITNCVLRSDLVDAQAEPQIAYRRTAYFVEIEPSASKPLAVNVTIRTLIEYRRRIEARWREQGDDPRNFYFEEATRLRAQLDKSR